VDWKKKIEDMSLGELAVVASIVVYTTGYLISSFYVRSRGINDM
jgi:hypothetical protein